MNGLVERFEHDDQGYEVWLGAHPTGFVINCYPTPSPAYLVLHRASCMHISVRGSNMEHWTHDYIKVCAEKNGHLIAWAEETAGARPTACTTCGLLSPGSVSA